VSKKRGVNRDGVPREKIEKGGDAEAEEKANPREKKSERKQGGGGEQITRGVGANRRVQVVWGKNSQADQKSWKIFGGGVA